jgi:hypothetical protein
LYLAASVSQWLAILQLTIRKKTTLTSGSFTNTNVPHGMDFLLYLLPIILLFNQRKVDFSKSLELIQEMPVNLWRKLQGSADFNLGKTDNASGAVAIVR